MERYIIEGLEKYINEDNVPWHMPGHKRRLTDSEASCDSINECERNSICIENILENASRMDVTEVDGTDDLHHPEDMIKDSQRALKEVYGTYASYYMVNGSTGGILSAISACSIGKNKDNKNIIIANNCHKSVFNAIEILGLNPIYIDVLHNENIGNVDNINNDENKRSFDINMALAVNVCEVKKICEATKNICCMVLTSPTYEGVISDIGAIKNVLEPYNIPLVVDEAHGAHLQFINELPKSAISFNADIVVQSLHKTIDAFTQTAIIHVNNKEYDGEVRKYLSVYMSSSPSYILLTSMEYAISRAIKKSYSDYLIALNNFISKIDTLKHINIYTKDMALKEGAYDYDISRIVLYSDVINGPSFEKILRQYNMVIEMSTADYVVLISTTQDKQEDFNRLYEALINIDEVLDKKEIEINNVNEQEMFEYLDSLIGKKAVDNIYVYPPGNYIVVKNEPYTSEKIEIIKKNLLAGKKIRGNI